MHEGGERLPHQRGLADHELTHEQLLGELRKLAEERDRLRAQLEQRSSGGTSLDLAFRAAFRAAPAVMVLLSPDSEFRMVEMSDQRLQSTMTTREDTIDRPLFDVFTDNLENAGAVGRVSMRDSLLRVLETKQPQDLGLLRYDLLHPDGGYEERYWHPLNIPLLGPDGELLNVLHIAEDVTNEVRLRSAESERDRLTSLSTATDQFLGILSHELRTPIHAITGFGSILADGLAGPLNPDQGRYVDKVLARSEDLMALMDDLLDMTRVRTGKFSLERTEVDVAPLLHTVLAEAAPQARAKNLRLHDRVPATLGAIQADARRLMQIVNNLVTNAIKYTPRGEITVTARVEGARMRVEVADTGIGIDACQREYIFEAFTQVDMSNTRQVGGLGLGLAIAVQLVRAHGGTIGVESAPGEGSTFWFELPLAGAEEADG